MATVEPGGYDVPTYEERRADPVVTLWKQTWGPDADTSSETPDGLVIDILTKMQQALDERGAEAYANGFFTTASGLDLDNLIRPLVGAERAPDRGSTGEAVMYGEVGTTVPGASLVSTSQSGDVYVLDSPVEIAFSTIAVVLFGPANNEASFTSIDINGFAYAPIAGQVGTGLEVAQNQASAMPSSDDRIKKLHPAYSDPAGNGVLVIEMNGFYNVVSTASQSQVTDLRGSVGQVTSQEPGPIPGDAFSITSIVTPINGWTGVVNLTEMTPGAEQDNDAQYRERTRQTLGQRGAGTVLSLLGKLRSQEFNPGVEFVEVYDSFQHPDVVPGPCAYEAVVEGGTEENIVNIIWEDFQLGIQSVGDITVVVDDPRAAGSHLVRYTRPTKAYVWADVDITRGEGFPADETSNIQSSVTAALVAWGNSLGVGRDVYINEAIQQLQVPGASALLISIGSQPNSGDPKPALSSSNLLIDARGLSIWEAGKITVTIT
jgi:hypothetical protein